MRLSTPSVPDRARWDQKEVHPGASSERWIRRPRAVSAETECLQGSSKVGVSEAMECPQANLAVYSWSGANSTEATVCLQERWAGRSSGGTEREWEGCRSFRPILCWGMARPTTGTGCCCHPPGRPGEWWACAGRRWGSVRRWRCRHEGDRAWDGSRSICRPCWAHRG